MWSLVILWWLMSCRNIKSQSQFSPLCPCDSWTFLFLATELKSISALSSDSAIRLLCGPGHPHIHHQFSTKEDWNAIMMSMRLNKVYNQHHNFRNMFRHPSSSTKLLFVDDTVKFYMKFRVLSVHFLPNSTHWTCFLSSHARSSVCDHPLYFCPGQVNFLCGFTHTLKNKSSHIVVPCKLSRLASSFFFIFHTLTHTDNMCIYTHSLSEWYCLCHYSSSCAK